MTNPGNAVGTNGAYGGRTSVNAFNDNLAGYKGRGILSGWACVPKSGLTVALGGSGTTRDVAIAEDDIGNKTTVNNISQQPIDITLEAAPTLGQRIDRIVAYVNNPPENTAGSIDNPDACGLIAVTGEIAENNPVPPTESQIRAAIGADGGVSTTAYYVVLATVSILQGATDIVSDNIQGGNKIGSITVDAALNPLSENPVQNKVIVEALGDISSILEEINGEEVNG